jgi:hypothetical protein
MRSSWRAMMRAKWSGVIARGKAYRTAQTSLFEAYAIENGYRKERLPKCPEFIDRLAEGFPGGATAVRT